MYVSSQPIDLGLVWCIILEDDTNEPKTNPKLEPVLPYHCIKKQLQHKMQIYLSASKTIKSIRGFKEDCDQCARKFPNICMYIHRHP